jgi:parallel beta-helix repeat protein
MKPIQLLDRLRDEGAIVVCAFLLGCLPAPVRATTRFVDINNPAPATPYTNWLTAATNIQDAVDVAEAGDQVLVTNGLYQTGARDVYGMSNRVAVTRPVMVRSLNGPAMTVIAGSGPNGSNAVRCVYLTNGAVLAGFTLTNGATQIYGDGYTNNSGGGVWCESPSGILSNCVLTGNSASYYGGGAYSAGLTNCVLSENSAFDGGGAHSGTLNNCTLQGNFAYYTGGGAYSSMLNNCRLAGNSAFYGGGTLLGILNNCSLSTNSAVYGGGAHSGTLNNCTLKGNWATNNGGGVFGCTLNNCTLTGNSAFTGGGAHYSTLNNCVVYYNTAPVYVYANCYSSTLSYCCTTPLPSGTGNVTNAPLFMDQAGGDLRLQNNSPCINAGNNTNVIGAADLDGNPRIIGGTVDIGAYECQSPALLDYFTWLQGYGLSSAASAVYADSDNDRRNNWQEWVAGTIPTNPASLLVLASPSVGAGGVTLTWASVTNRSYYVERATNLATLPGFSLLETDISGQPSTTSFTDTNSPEIGPALYRVGVQP